MQHKTVQVTARRAGPSHRQRQALCALLAWHGNVLGIRDYGMAHLRDLCSRVTSKLGIPYVSRPASTRPIGRRSSFRAQAWKGFEEFEGSSGPSCCRLITDVHEAAFRPHVAEGSATSSVAGFLSRAD